MKTFSLGHGSSSRKKKQPMAFKIIIELSPSDH